ncbi:putative secreted protein (Por secretion system target) [Nonlabens dokdonensis]|uniref:Regulatory P domain of the subtilisin-like proprotein convertases and other protease n=2 Tax=Nonlabens dokdonensis TaxID=328515 RepID=L7WDD2_NONDD|nr:T9SS type A sorting domain-containing protein [Nonlabens dokdonensis]AGC78104.1 regulatory P domain of the subtilisin-like proprotein convertases and other protease [Nonlabens dokdonensis DSW-6]PZX37166.1 putative secreted protein (Por secretion system target) [Nonlabens dokdonensis]
MRFLIKTILILYFSNAIAQNSGSFSGSLSSGNTVNTFSFTSSGNGQYLFTGSTNSGGGSNTWAVAYIGTYNVGNIGGDFDYTNDQLTFETNCVETGQIINIRIETVGSNISYTINYQFISSTFAVDPEPNDNFSQAINTIENTEYEGWFNNGDFPLTADSEDWYKFTSPRDGTLVVTLENGNNYLGSNVSIVVYQQSSVIVLPSFQTSNGNVTTITFENFNFSGQEIGMKLQSNCVSYKFSWQINSALSLEEIKTKFNMYPNPVSGSQLFTTAQGENVNYVIYNLTGQTVAKGSLQGNSINVTELKSNVYLIQINDGSQTVTKKFIKK